MCYDFFYMLHIIDLSAGIKRVNALPTLQAIIMNPRGSLFNFISSLHIKQNNANATATGFHDSGQDLFGLSAFRSACPRGSGSGSGRTSTL